MDEARAIAFRSLKPPCVELSQLALKFKTKKATGKQVIKSIENLYLVIQDVSKQENVLNGKLADYAFFPLSHVFRDSKELPVKTVEVALQCLLLLISCGWQTNISPELGKQLLILVAFLAGGSPVEAKSKNVNEELGNAAFQCLAVLFEFTKNAGLGTKGSIDSDNIPVLGHAISTVLEGVNNGTALSVQIAALYALRFMITGISDEGALRSFFPGIVSSLAKVLRPKREYATSYKVLVSSLQILESVLLKVISDQVAVNIENDGRHSNLITNKADESIDPWVKASSSQVKMALANVIPLRYHERSEVQASLFRLCVSIVQRCRKSLSQSIPMITETLITLCSKTKHSDAPNNLEIANSLFIEDPDLLDILKNSLHDWVVALPRIMQSNDDESKEKSINRISVAFQLISSQDSISDILNDTLSFNLRTSVYTAVQASNSQAIHPFSGGSLEMNQILQSPDPRENSVSFSLVLFNETSQKGILDGLERLAGQLKALPMSKNLHRGIVDSIRKTSGDEQLASVWLSLQLLKNDAPQTHDIDQYLNLPIESAEDPLLDDIYSFSLDILSQPTFGEAISWKLQALSLEVLALQANHQKEDFRPELVDTLYPILERMGSSNAALQHHAITCLNQVSRACRYPTPSALIVANADYLVNAVALKLNTFEISPQAPLVLVMMVKLCGPALVPYLDDLIESIFAILACFHGYPRLVESLFAVLRAVVEESGKTPLPALPSTTAPTTRQPSYKPTSIPDLIARLRNLQKPRSPTSSPPPSPPLPQSNDPPPPQTDENDPPLPPQTNLLLSIALQSQNHLNSPSPPLLLSLLSLLASAFPPLTPYPNRLLPLLASTFPLLLPALHSASPPISIAACAALTAACDSGGDFLATRVDDEWPALIALCARRRGEMLGERRSLGVRGAAKRRAWTALVDFLVTVVRAVGVRPEREDDVFDVLADERQRPAVRACLEDLNPDALWVVEMKGKGEEGRLVPPVVEGWTLPVLEF